MPCTSVQAMQSNPRAPCQRSPPRFAPKRSRSSSWMLCRCFSLRYPASGPIAHNWSDDRANTDGAWSMHAATSKGAASVPTLKCGGGGGGTPPPEKRPCAAALELPQPSTIGCRMWRPKDISNARYTAARLRLNAPWIPLDSYQRRPNIVAALVFSSPKKTSWRPKKSNQTITTRCVRRPRLNALARFFKVSAVAASLSSNTLMKGDVCFACATGPSALPLGPP